MFFCFTLDQGHRSLWDRETRTPNIYAGGHYHECLHIIWGDMSSIVFICWFLWHLFHQNACLYYCYNHKSRWRKVVGGGRGWLHVVVLRRWAVELRVFTHTHVSMITYRVDIYRSRPIGASLLTTSPQQGCLSLKGLHTGAGWAWWRVSAWYISSQQQQLRDTGDC